MPLDDWFLTPGERGNAATAIDSRRGDGIGWTEANRVGVLADGAAYFRRLYEALSSLEAGDCVYFTDWQGDGDELLAGPGTEIGRVLADAARRGAQVRGLLWRSHPRQAHFAEQSNAALAKMVDEAGGEIVLDERVRRGGSHHQKLVVLRHGTRSDDDVAFEGGIDLCHGRRDDSQHAGDPQAVALDSRYGTRPPWHDVQLEVRGPAVGDLAYTFRGTLGGPDAARPSQSVAPRRPTLDPRAAPPRSVAPRRRRPRTTGDQRRAGSPHLPRETAAVPVRARR